MNRRNALKTLGMSGASLVTTALMTDPLPAEAQSSKEGANGGIKPQRKNLNHSMEGYGIPTGPPQQIAMLLYPQFTALDLIGPYTLLAALMNVEVHLVSKKPGLVTSDQGLAVQATTTFDKCPENLTVLFVPGGSQGTIAAMNDPTTRNFLAKKGKAAKYVTSVCTGSILLGAAGLLRGYRATSHWAVRDLLAQLGAKPVKERVVEDRNRITGAGVTAGLDFGLRLAALLRNEKYAKALQLAFEYDPKPLYQAGTPEGAGADIVEMEQAMYAPIRAQMQASAKRITQDW
jgi:cyclohexyl-isocyanide hydratase